VRNVTAGAPRRIDATELAAIVTRLRRILRTAVRSDYPWEILPMAQVEILQRLADEPGLRVRDLADRHRLAPNTISTLIQQMVTAGLVTRKPDATDRRAVTVSLTAAGEQALAGWSTANRYRLEAALAELPDRDRRTIGAALPALSRLVAELERVDRDRARQAAADAGVVDA
jgi:DNA-binding MarR family transcriptional regulator